MFLEVMSVPFQCSELAVLSHLAPYILNTHVLPHYNPSALDAYHTRSYCNALQQWLQ